MLTIFTTVLQFLWHALQVLEGSGCIKDVDCDYSKIRGEQLQISLTAVEDLYYVRVFKYNFQSRVSYLVP